MFPFLFWGTVACAVFWGSKSLLQSVAGRRRGPGRWVYDRSLGGKKVRGKALGAGEREGQRELSTGAVGHSPRGAPST